MYLVGRRFILIGLGIILSVVLVALILIPPLLTPKKTSVEIEWEHKFEGILGLSSIIQTADEGFIIAGVTPYGSGGGDLLLIKTNTTGHHEWNRTLGGTRSEYFLGFNAMVQTTDGGFVLTGITYSYGSGGGDIWLIKTNITGYHEWNRTFGGTQEDFGNSVVQTTDGGFILAGGTESYGAGGSDIWLVKTNATGHHEWNRTFGGTGAEHANDVVQTTDGGFVIAGITGSYGPGGGDIWLIKTNATGHHEWNRTLGGASGDRTDSMVQTADGGLVLVGATASYGAGRWDIWLIKTDATGHHEWNRTFGGTKGEHANDMVQTADGGLVLVGATTSYGAGDSDIWLVKTDASGHHEWDFTFGGTQGDWGISVIQTADGGFILAGITFYDKTNLWLLKIITTEETTSQSSSLWTPVISILSLITLLIFQKRIRFH